MRPAHFLRVLTLLSLAFLGAVRAYPGDIKSIHPTGYVTDLAGVVSAEKKASLETLSTELEQKTGAQLAIVTVQSLEGESVEQYAVDLFKQLGIGSKKDNRGVLLLVAPNDRKYRIEVSYGLEPVINDARVGDAGRAMVPFLRQGDYGKAAEVGAWQLAKYIADDAGVTLSGQPPVHQVRDEQSGGRIWPFLLVVALMVFFRAIGNVETGRAGRRASDISGLLGFLLGMFAGGSGGRSGGSWGSGGFGGSGGGFGGFGGGSSGGGGASGSW